MQRYRGTSKHRVGLASMQPRSLGTGPAGCMLENPSYELSTQSLIKPMNGIGIAFRSLFTMHCIQSKAGCMLSFKSCLY